VLGTVLWIINWAVALATARRVMNASPTTAVSVSGVSFVARAWMVALVLFVVALRYSEEAGLAAAGVFLAAFTFDLLGRTLIYAGRERTAAASAPATSPDPAA
jgi:hypothetical protein